MKQKISMLLIVAMFIVSMLGCSTKSEANFQITTTSEDYIPSETSYIQKEVSDIEIPQIVEEIESEEEIKEIEEEIPEVEELEVKQEEELEWIEKSEEYESAAFIWKYFEDKGYSDYAIAGILGNIMAEVGGQTLYIQYWLSSSSYYGMCQWSRQYYPEAIGLSLEEQCDFLFNTIENEFDVFGYIVGLSYEDFIQIENEQTAALAFAKVYERCGSGSYSVRQSNATEAYNYFVD